MKWKRKCVVCGKEEGDPNGKVIKIFCKDCLREIRDQRWLVEWARQKEARFDNYTEVHGLR